MVSFAFYDRWSTKDLQCQGRLSIDSTGHRNMKITAGLGGSNLDSKGGIIGGAIDLQELNAFCKFSLIRSSVLQKHLE